MDGLDAGGFLGLLPRKCPQRFAVPASFSTWAPLSASPSRLYGVFHSRGHLCSKSGSSPGRPPLECLFPISKWMYHMSCLPGEHDRNLGAGWIPGRINSSIPPCAHRCPCRMRISRRARIITVRHHLRNGSVPTPRRPLKPVSSEHRLRVGAGIGRPAGESGANDLRA